MERHVPGVAPLDKGGFIPYWCIGCWLIVSFGEHQMMAERIAKRVLISPLLTGGFPFATLSSLVTMLLR
jgi:hypothetical protein